MDGFAGSGLAVAVLSVAAGAGARRASEYR
jgi:hypothetical protein